jgi:hypothetical protein
MANTDIDLKVARLFNQETGRGYNVKVEIDWRMLVDNAPSGESTGDTQTYTITNLPIGSKVRDVHFVLNEEFNIDGNDNISFSMGDDNDVDGYIVGTAIGTAISVTTKLQDGAYWNSTDTVSSEGETDDVTVTLPTTTNGKIYNAGEGNLIVQFTPVANVLSAMTAGKITFYADILFP